MCSRAGTFNGVSAHPSSEINAGAREAPLSAPLNQDTHRDKTGTLPHDSGTPTPLHFQQRNNEWADGIATALWIGTLPRFRSR